MLQKTGSGCERQSDKWKVTGLVIYDTHCPYWWRQSLNCHCRRSTSIITCSSIFTVDSTCVGPPAIIVDVDNFLLTLGQCKLFFSKSWIEINPTYHTKIIYRVVKCNPCTQLLHCNTSWGTNAWYFLYSTWYFFFTWQIFCINRIWPLLCRLSLII